MPSTTTENESIALPETVEVKVDNTPLIDYFEQQKQLELEQQAAIQKEQETLILETQQTEDQILQDEIKFRDDLLKELRETKQINYEMSLKQDEFYLKIYNEQIALHNDFYVFFGLFISAFVVFIFAKGWFGNAL